MGFWASILSPFRPVQGAKPKVRRSSRWPAVRARHLELEPCCAVCGSRENIEVHHVRPVHLAPDLELCPGNLVTLCEGNVVNCHLLFGHLRNWKAWNPTVKLDTAFWSEKIRSRPMTAGDP